MYFYALIPAIGYNFLWVNYLLHKVEKCKNLKIYFPLLLAAENALRSVDERSSPVLARQAAAAAHIARWENFISCSVSSKSLGGSQPAGPAHSAVLFKEKRSTANLPCPTFCNIYFK